jgi:hypothetical protein
MTSEGLGEMYEGDFADLCMAKISAHVGGGLSGGSSVHRTRSEDPHRCERKFKMVYIIV